LEPQHLVPSQSTKQPPSWPDSAPLERGGRTWAGQATRLANGKATTNVVFTEPGTYVIRAYADDGIVTTPADVTINVTGTAKTP